MMISKNIPGVLKNQSTKNLLEMGNMLFNKQILEINSPKDRYGIAKALPNELTNRMYDNEKTAYPFDKETIADIEKNYKPLGNNWQKRKEAIKQRIAFENVFNLENEITDFTLSELYQLIKDLKDSGEIMNKYNFYIPAEIGAELIKIVCEDNQNEINEIAEIIYKETQMENPTFEHTLKLIQKYYDDYEKKRKFENDLKDMQSIVDIIIDNTLRHNFKQKSSTENYTPLEFLPQVLSRKVANLLQFDYNKHFNLFCKIEDSIKKYEPIHRYVFETVTLAYGRRWLSVLDFQDNSGEQVKMKIPLKRYKETQMKFVDLANMLDSKSYKGKPISDKYLKILTECYEAIKRNLNDDSLDAFKTYTDKEVEVINDVFDNDVDTIIKCFNALNESPYSDNANNIICDAGKRKYGYFPKQYFPDNSRNLVDPSDVVKDARHFFMQLDTLRHHFIILYPHIKKPIDNEWDRKMRAIKKRCKEQKEEFGGNIMKYKPSDTFDDDLRLSNRSTTVFTYGEPNLPTTFEVIEHALEQMQCTDIKLVENEKSLAATDDTMSEVANENLQFDGISIYKILDHLKDNKFPKANHKIYVLNRLKILDEVLEKCNTHKEKYDKLIELDIITDSTSLSRVQKIITHKGNKGHNDYPFKSCANKIDEILEDHFNITLPKQQTP